MISNLVDRAIGSATPFRKDGAKSALICTGVRNSKYSAG